MSKTVYRVVVEDNRTCWYNEQDQLHRLDGPAIERADGPKSWWFEGKLHRVDGPAFERADGTKEWYRNDQLHREDGPAIERADGSKEWYLNDQQLTKQEFIQRTTTPEYTMEQLVNLVGHNFKIKKNN